MKFSGNHNYTRERKYWEFGVFAVFRSRLAAPRNESLVFNSFFIETFANFRHITICCRKQSNNADFLAYFQNSIAHIVTDTTKNVFDE